MWKPLVTHRCLDCLRACGYWKQAPRSHAAIPSLRDAIGLEPPSNWKRGGRAAAQGRRLRPRWHVSVGECPAAVGRFAECVLTLAGDVVGGGFET